MIKRKERLGRLRGVSVNQGAPTTSNLFFLRMIVLSFVELRLGIVHKLQRCFPHMRRNWGKS